MDRNAEKRHLMLLQMRESMFRLTLLVRFAGDTQKNQSSDWTK